MRFLLSASVAVASLISFDVYAQTCQKAPDCASLGYTKSESDCSGRTYTVCPFDTTKYSCDTTTCADLGYTDTIAECPGEYDVCQYDKTKGKCIYEARPGDLKYSWQVKDHNGWLLCNGRAYFEKQFPELYAAIGTAVIPNYKNYYLRGAAETSTSKFGSSKYQTLPNITGHMYSFMTGGANVNEGALYQESGGDSGGKSGSNYTWRHIYFDANRSDATYGRPDEEKGETTAGSGTQVNPNHYLANIFIFAGKNKNSNISSATCGYAYSDGTVSSSLNSSKTVIGYVPYYSKTILWVGGSYSANVTSSMVYALDSMCKQKGGVLATSSDISKLFTVSTSCNVPTISSIMEPGVNGRNYIVSDFSTSGKLMYICNKNSSTGVVSCGFSAQTEATSYYYCKKSLISF